MKLAITMTHATRPDYSAQSLLALRCALRRTPLMGFRLSAYLAVEPGVDRTLSLCRQFADDPDVTESMHGGVAVMQNQTVHGVNLNTANVIDAAFADGADAILHCEDDCPVALDAIEFFAWALERFADEAQVGTITGYNRLAEIPPESEWRTVATRAWFHPWTFATWKDRWPALRAAIPTRTNYTWDGYVLAEMKRREWREAYPVLSRCDNIGIRSSVHPDLYPPSFYAEHHKLKVHAGMVNVVSGEWEYRPDNV